MDSIDKLIYEFFGNGNLGKAMICLITLLIVIFLSLLCYIVFRLALYILKNKSKLQNIRYLAKCIRNRRISEKASVLLFFFFLSNFAERLLGFKKFVEIFSNYAMVIMLMLILSSVMDIINDVYTTKDISKKRPIKGPLQIVKVLLFTVMGIILISMLLNQNPIVLISGIGTFTAILSIVFKDALLGLVAGVQITSDNLLQIDDWVVIPSLSVEGSVKDISLVTVKIKAFDNTIITVPAYTFMSVPFKNFHNTIKDQERQIAKTISVDVNTIRVIDEFEAGEIIRKHKKAFEDHPVEGGLTNLYYYRTYLESRLHSDSHIKEDFNIVCKTTESKGLGVVIEIYATTDISDFEEFTNYGSQIIEMALVSLKDFDLKPYQSIVSK